MVESLKRQETNGEGILVEALLTIFRAQNVKLGTHIGIKGLVRAYTELWTLEWIVDTNTKLQMILAKLWQ